MVKILRRSRVDLSLFCSICCGENSEFASKERIRANELGALCNIYTY